MPDQNTLFMILAVITGMTVTSFSIPIIIKVSLLKGLIDPADRTRKINNGHTPTLGGVSLFFGVTIGYSLWVREASHEFYPYLFAAMVILFAIGLKDDILVIDPRKKFLMQLVAVAILVVPGRIRLCRMDGFLGLFDNPAPSLVIAASFFAFVVIINAYNLIDGIDGLAGSQALLGTMAMGAWFFINGHMAEALLAAAMSGSVIGFLIHNKSPAKIYMGDTGSLIIGLIMAVLALQLIHRNAESTEWKFLKPAVFAFSAMIIPMFDTFRVIFLRLVNGASPFQADNRHLHHCLLRYGFHHNGISIILFLSGLLLLILAARINHVNIHISLTILMMLAGLIIPMAWLIRRFLGKKHENKLHDPLNGRAFLHEVIGPYFYGRMEAPEPAETERRDL